MLGLTIPETRLWDEKNEIFIYTPETLLLIEHSLASLSKWEQITEKPFLAKDKKTDEEIQLYVQCMNVAPITDVDIFKSLTQENYETISKHIDAKMTATWFKESAPNRGNGEAITAEIIYYWMITLNIPSEYQYWHLNRLLTLVRVLNLKNAPAKKMSRTEQLAQQRALNEQRQRERNSRG